MDIWFRFMSKCVICKENSDVPVLEVEMTASKMFPFKVSSMNHALVTSVENDSWLWHKRYGHLNFHGLKLLHEKKMVIGLPSINQVEEVCEGCIYGKHQRASFPNGKSWRAKKPLQLVHSDICGPMQTPSLSNSKYFLLFIDDFSRICWVYFLKSKSEAFSEFLIFKAQVEKECGYLIHTLRTDGGGEFCSNEFVEFY